MSPVPAGIHKQGTQRKPLFMKKYCRPPFWGSLFFALSIYFASFPFLFADANPRKRKKRKLWREGGGDCGVWGWRGV